MDLMKSYRKANPDMSYRDMVNDYNTSYQKFEKGGEFNDYKQSGPLATGNSNDSFGFSFAKQVNKNPIRKQSEIKERYSAFSPNPNTRSDNPIPATPIDFERYKRTLTNTNPKSQIEAEDMIKEGLIDTKVRYEEDGDTAGENVFEVIDPTGISSWDDIYRSAKNTGFSGQTSLEVLGALPLIGKISKSGKVITGGFGMLNNTVKVAKYLPAKTQEKVLNNAYKAYQEYVRMGGKNIDNMLTKPVELLKDNIPYINPEKWKSSQIAINTANKLFKAGKVSDAYQAYDQYQDEKLKNTK
jgi:hypothetical protein